MEKRDTWGHCRKQEDVKVSGRQQRTQLRFTNSFRCQPTIEDKIFDQSRKIQLNWT